VLFSSIIGDSTVLSKVCSFLLLFLYKSSISKIDIPITGLFLTSFQLTLKDVTL